MRRTVLILIAMLGCGWVKAQTPLPSPTPPPAATPPENSAIGPAFRTACWNGDLAQVTQMLDQGAPIEGRDSLGRPPLLLATRGHPDVVKLLLAHGAKVDNAAFNGDTAIGHACETGDLASAKLLVEAGANINGVNKYGHTPLMLAVTNGFDQVVAYLIGLHVDVNFESQNQSAIHLAVWKDRPTILKMLFDAGAKEPPSASPSDHIPLLAWAALANDLPLIDLLLANGIDINLAGKDGVTGLSGAIDNAKIETVTYLLDKGADMEKQDDKGVAALTLATLLKKPDVMQLLLDRHANLEAKDKLGRTALVWACCRIANDEIRILVDHGADLNVTDLKGETPLNYLANRGDMEMVQLLKDKGAHPVEIHIINYGDKSFAPLTPVQSWALAVSAIYALTNGTTMNVLGAGESQKGCAFALKRDWEVTDKKTLLAELDNLRDTGHHTDYQIKGAMYAGMTEDDFTASLSSLSSEVAQHNKSLRSSYLKWKERSGLAWDIVRSASLVNLGYAAGYIDEQESWNRLFANAELAQKSFSSWQELSDNFLDGREIWSGTRAPQFDACTQLLLDPKQANSPWIQNPWKAPLSGDPVPATPPAQ